MTDGGCGNVVVAVFELNEIFIIISQVPCVTGSSSEMSVRVSVACLTALVVREEIELSFYLLV